MRTIIGTLLGVTLIACGAIVIYAIVRFGIISPRKTRGAKERLRNPDPRDIEALTGVRPSHELIEFYRHATFVESTEFYLVDRSKDPPVTWFVGGFSPLTALDVREELKVSGIVAGIPIGDDMDKGTYFVAADGSVRSDSPNVRGRVREVAPTLAIFARFELSDVTSDG